MQLVCCTSGHFGRFASLQSESQGPLCAQRDVDDVRSPDDIDSFVRVIGDVICSGPIELDENVVDWVVESLSTKPEDFVNAIV
jgi:hypothetical protein